LIEIVKKLIQLSHNFNITLSEKVIREYGCTSFLILVSCLLSLRSKDSETIHVCRKLFLIAQTPQEILKLPDAILEKIIYRIGFYKNKARTLKDVSKTIIEKFNGEVPDTLQELLSIKGIGRKTANLMFGVAFNKPAICVDIHVHRISNRLGLVKTNKPEETEFALQKVLPQKYWIEWNRLLVMWGQNICTPVSPFCSQCEIKSYCTRVGVTKSR